MTEWVLENLLLTGAGAGALIFIIGRFMPNGKLGQWGFDLGVLITAKGDQALGRKFWERIEHEFISFGGAFFKGLVKGLESDDNGEKKDESK